MTEIKIDTRTIYGRGKRGLALPLPRSYTKDLDLQAKDPVDIYRDEEDRLILVPAGREKKEEQSA